MKKYVRVDVGPDGFASSTTLDDSSATQSVLSIIYPKNFGESISSVTMEFMKDTNTANDTVLGPGKEIRIWHKDTLPVGNSDADRIFRGYVNTKEVGGSRVSVTADDLFIKAMWTTGTTTQDYESATAVKTVLTALCTAAGLTASNNAATPAPLNVEKFYSNNQNIFERISYILNLIGWYGYYDPTTTQTIVFQPKSAGELQTFDNTINTAILDGMEWKNDATNLINDVKVIGGSNQITTTENKTPTGGVAYTLTAGSVNPENVIVSGTGTYPQTSWSSNEFTVLSNGIWFTKGTEPVVGGTLHITFTYQTSSNSSTSDNATSQAAYVKRSKVIRKNDTVNSTDLSNWASKLVNFANTVPFWEIPIQEVSFSVMDSILYPILGSRADVTDIASGRSLTYATNGSIIYMVAQRWPRPGTRILISTKPLKNPMQQTTVQDNIEKINIEVEKIDPTSLLRKDASTPLIGSQDFCGYELRNIRFENSAVAPDNLGLGGIYYDTDDNLLYYNKNTVWTEIGLGAGVTDHGALMGLGDNDHPQYLLLTGGTLTGDLISDSTAPKILLKYSTAARGQIDANNTVFEIYPIGVPMTLGAETLNTEIYGDTITFLTGTPATRLTIADAAITAAVPLAMGSNAITTNSTVDGVDVSTIPSTYLALAGGTLTGDLLVDKTSPQITLKNGAANYSYWIGTAAYSSITCPVGHLYLACDQAAHRIYLQTSSTTRLTIADAVITAAVPLAMGSNAITTNSTVDGVDVSAIPSTYLALTGGTLTGDLISDSTAPKILLKYSTFARGQIDADNTVFEIYPIGVPMTLGAETLLTQVYGDTIEFLTGDIPAVRLLISDTAITAGLALSMGSNNITFNAGATVDGVDVSTIPTTYLALGGGTLVGDLISDSTAPKILLKYSTVARGQIDANNTVFEIYPIGVPMTLGAETLNTEIYGDTITFLTGTPATTRLAISDSVTITLGTGGTLTITRI